MYSKQASKQLGSQDTQEKGQLGAKVSSFLPYPTTYTKALNPSQSFFSSTFAAERNQSYPNFSLAFISFKISTFYAHSYQISRDQRLNHVSFGYRFSSEQDLDKGKVYLYSLCQQQS